MDTYYSIECVLQDNRWCNNGITGGLAHFCDTDNSAETCNRITNLSKRYNQMYKLAYNA